MNKLSTEKRTLTLKLLVDGMSMRGIMRVADISYNAVQKLLRDAGAAAQWWHDARVRNIDAGAVEADEVWSFVRCKERRILDGSAKAAQLPHVHAGHTWTWTALDAESKLMISWLTAPRSFDSALALMRDLRARCASIRQLSSDGLYACEAAVEDAFGPGGINYGAYVKPNTTDAPHDEQTYERPKPVKRAVCGSPDEDRINTSFIERSNLTLRMGNRRFTRKTNAYSKQLENHKHALALFFVHYNWCRPHMSLGKKVTPAMAAGLANSPYPISSIGTLIDIRALKPRRPKFYSTARRSATEAARMAAMSA